MRVVVTRVRWAQVEVEGEVCAKIGQGLLVLLGSEEGDTDKDISYICEKVCGLRIFADDAGKMNRSVREVGGELLLVSQFTLLGDVRKGKRPSFIRAGAPAEAQGVYEAAVEAFRATGIPVQTGVFQAHMQVSSQNDGPVTILLDSRRLF